MKVSVVIPCYHGKGTIDKVVESVRGAPLNSKEIIVVDDCSQDGTQTLLRQYRRHRPRELERLARCDGLTIWKRRYPDALGFFPLLAPAFSGTEMDILARKP